MYKLSQIAVLLAVFFVFLGGLFALPKRALDTSDGLFDSSTVHVVDGQVLTVDSLRSNMKLLFATDAGERVVVLVAPSWYMVQQKFKILPGDRLSITGSWVINDNHQTIIPIQIKRNSDIIQLRDSQGNPVWSDENPFPLNSNAPTPTS